MDVFVKLFQRVRRELVMKKKMIVFILSAIILTEIICIAGLCMCEAENENSNGITIRELPQQTVLYTIFRGRDNNISDSVNKLYSLAELKGLSPCGPLSTCCLSDSGTAEDHHKLIEIQIPVESQAIELAGTLGDMTDVKVIPSMKVAVAVKPEGKNDPTEIIEDLFSWINKKGFVVKGRMKQNILNRGNGAYHTLKSEFLIPIGDLQDKYRLTLTMDPCYM